MPWILVPAPGPQPFSFPGIQFVFRLSSLVILCLDILVSHLAWL